MATTNSNFVALSKFDPGSNPGLISLRVGGA
jgi:hypothetical protein